MGNNKIINLCEEGAGAGRAMGAHGHFGGAGETGCPFVPQGALHSPGAARDGRKDREGGCAHGAGVPGVPVSPLRHAFPPRSKPPPFKTPSPSPADHAAGFMERDVLAEIPPSPPSALNPQPALPGRPHDTEHAKTASFCLCISNLFYLFDISHT